MRAIRDLHLVKRLLMVILGTVTIPIPVLVTDGDDWLTVVALSALTIAAAFVLEAVRRVRRVPARIPEMSIRDLQAAYRLMTLLAWPLVISLLVVSAEAPGWHGYVGGGALCVAAFAVPIVALKLSDVMKHLCPACGVFWEPEEDAVYLTSLSRQCARDPERVARAWGFPAS